MKRNFFLSPFAEAYQEERFIGSRVLVVDIFRATTTMLNLFLLGVEEIRLLAGPEEGEAFTSPEWLKVGERDSAKIPGFDVNNSPREISALFIERGSLPGRAAMVTSNGTRAALRARLGEALFVACFNNLSCVLDRLLLYPEEENWFFALAGDGGRLSLEDSLFAGVLIGEVEKRGVKTVLDDGSLLAREAAKTPLGWEALLREGVHTQELQNKGFREDILIALQRDRCPLLPRIEGRTLRLT